MSVKDCQHTIIAGTNFEMVLMWQGTGNARVRSDRTGTAPGKIGFPGQATSPRGADPTITERTSGSYVLGSDLNRIYALTQSHEGFDAHEHISNTLPPDQARRVGVAGHAGLTALSR
jgi:hypothetical protein